MPEVEAHITGTVWKIECAVGDQIEEGDTVAILESMKMEMPVEAEDSGTVAEILCEEGQAVSEGDTLVVLDPSGPRKVLRELAVRAPDRLAALVEHDAGRPRRPLIDCEDHPRRRAYPQPARRGASAASEQAGIVTRPPSRPREGRFRG